MKYMVNIAVIASFVVFRFTLGNSNKNDWMDSYDYIIGIKTYFSHVFVN